MSRRHRLQMGLALALGLGAGALAIALLQAGAAGQHAGQRSHAEHTGHAHQMSHADHADHAEHAGHGAPAPAARPAEGTQVHFADVLLVDQHERPVRLKEDVVDDKIVVMGFIYTRCTTVCPVVSAILQKVQAQLGERAGRDVRLVSLSVDPLRDTPQRLREYAAAYQPGPGWFWLTGTLPAVTATLKGLGAWAADFENHPPSILVGDGRSAQWTRFYGFTDPALLLAKVEELGAARSRARGNERFMVESVQP